MREWFIKWLGIKEPTPVDKSEPKTCEKDGHDWGRVKQWITPSGRVVQRRKCRRCEQLEV